MGLFSERLGEITCPNCHHHFEAVMDNFGKSSFGETFTCHKCKTVFRKRYKKIPLYGLILSPLAMYGVIYLIAHLDGVSDEWFHLLWIWLLVFGLWTVRTSSYEVVDKKPNKMRGGSIMCPSCQTIVGVGFLDMRFACSQCGKTFSRRINGWTSFLLSLGLILMAVAVANDMGVMWWLIGWLFVMIWALQSASWQEVKK